VPGVPEFPREEYKRVLAEVLDTPDDILPKTKLTNIMAKRKARLYLDQMEEIFRAMYALAD
jgi:hypothetical protein